MTDNQSNPVSNNMTCFIDEDKNTQLHYAAAYGDVNAVKKHIEDGHEIDLSNYLDWTPLMMATRYGHIEVVQILLNKHADSTRANKFGFNILLMAIACGKLDLLQVILHHLLCGGVSKQSMQRLFSPVSLAVLFNNTQVVHYLLEKGFCINKPTDTTELTPMMFANAMGNVDIINLLAAKGAKGRKPSTAIEKQMLDTLHGKQTFNKPVPNVPPPLLLVGGTPFSPHPTFLNVTPNLQMPRKCSELASPCFTPNVSPLPPGAFVHQVFFPQNFSPSHFISPVTAGPVFSNGNDFLNIRLMHPSPYYSPAPFNPAY